MGQPAEARALVAHLLNVRLPYDYTNPDFALLCQGISELTENFEADTEDVQYICETTKTTNTKGYKVGFDLSIGYIKNNKVQRWVNKILRKPPTGSNTACDYIRFNKDEMMYGTNNQFIGVRRRSTVQAGSIGGAATDSMTSEIHISGTSDPEVGYVSVTENNDKTIKYTWTPATTEPPIITAPEEGVVINETNVTISGTGVVGAEVTVYYGLDKHANAAKVDVNGKWSVAIAAADFGTQATIAATQTISGMGSVSSDPVSFRVLTTLEAPVITVPSNGQKDVPITPTISGTGEAGATVEVKSGNEVILSTTVGDDKKWSGTVTTALTAEEEYTITATQKIGSVVSTASTAVKFTTVSA